ncbi:uncharacterized protein LOC143054168 [Mytilus galloprovincialis]|uniref:uncharacterized protein LOC143054168 n=1 Tax=Mytilus galloprovincialis TaxID=29158 RepID=UPI003F7CC321
MLLEKELCDFSSEMYLDLIMKFNNDIEFEETNKFTEKVDLRTLDVNQLMNSLEKSLSVSIDKVEKMLNKKLEASDLIRLCHIGIEIANSKFESSRKRRSAESDGSPPNKKTLIEITNPNPIQHAIPLELERRLIEMEYSSHTGPPGDLDVNKKRWLVVGIGLHSILSPALRKYVEPVLNNFYKALKLSDQIDKQSHPRHLRTNGVRNVYLNYEPINMNKTTHGYRQHLYDYKVQNAVDLSKLFLQTYMAHYTAFDGSCDSSALLGMIDKIDMFPGNVRTFANDVKSNVRNDWAHCNFTVWDDVKYVQSLKLIEDLIYLLRLNAPDEKQMIDELDKWRKNGTSFLQGYTISGELANEIRQQIQILKKYAEVIYKTADTEFEKVNVALIDIGETLRQYGKRISTLENTVAIQGKTLMEYGSSYDADIPEIQRWKQNSKDFIKTDIFTEILGIIKSNHCVLLTGVSGMGKTLTAQNIALQLCQEEGYSIVPCNTVKDIKKRYKDNVRQVFFVDDICGKYTANIKYIENWMRIKEFVTFILRKGQTKILATCRTEIVKEDNVEKTLKCILEQFDLTKNYSTEDKLKLARKYLKVEDKVLTDIVKKVEFSPLISFLYSKHDGFDVNEFLNSPYQTFSDEWDTLKTFDKEKFCALLLCVIYYGTINETNFDVPNDLDIDEEMKLKNVFDCCRLGRDTPLSAIKDKLNTCVDTYFIKVDKEFKVIHDKMFDFLCCYFGKTFIAPVLKFADDKLIRERVQLESIQKTPVEFSIMVSSIDEQKYNDRLRTDLLNGKIHLCLNNSQMRYKEYRHKLLDVVRALDIDTKKRLITTKDENGMTTFIVSCLRGFADLVDYFLSIGAAIDVQIGLFTPLTAACRDGHLQTVKSLLYKGAAINKTNFDGETPLYTACFGGHYDLIKILIEKGADINKKNIYNHTPLYVSSLEGHKDIVNMLIENGANIFKCSDSLIGATNGGHDQIVETLITKDFDVNIVDMQGRTALAIACEEGFTKIVKFLVDNNADVNMLDIERETCLHKAYRNGSVEVIQTLLAKRADVNITNRNGQTPADVSKTGCKIMDAVLFNTSENVQLETNESVITSGTPKETSYQPIPDRISELLRYKWTPLYAACMRGDVETVKSLIKNRANVNMKTDSGELSLVAACQQGHGILIQMLQDEGADINQALLSAVQRDKERAVKILMCKGIYSGFKRGDFGYKGCGWKWLMKVACEHKSTTVIGILLQKSDDVLFSDTHTTTCTACTHEFHQIVELLIKKRPEFNYHCNEDESTPMYSACKKRFNRVVEMLIENGVDLNEADINGTTLFHYACLEDNLDLCQLLTDKGIFGTYKADKYGKYPLYMAMGNGFENVGALETGFENGYTPFILADIAGNDDLAKYLESQALYHNPARFISLTNGSIQLMPIACFEAKGCHKRVKIEHTRESTENYEYLFQVCMNGEARSSLLEERLARLNINIFFAPEGLNGTIWFKQTPLCLATRRGHREVVDVLLKNGANVDLTVDGHSYPHDNDGNVFASTIRYGYTPLFAAYQRKYYEIVDLLVKNAANLNKALYDACREGYLDTAQLLLLKGADVNSFGRFGQTALHAACIGGYYTIVKYLLDQGAHVKTTFKMAFIHKIACLDVVYACGNHRIFKLLTERGASINRVSKREQTLLYTACVEGNYKTVKILVAKGADVNASDKHGTTPLYACITNIDCEKSVCYDMLRRNFNSFKGSRYRMQEDNYSDMRRNKPPYRFGQLKNLNDNHYKIVQNLIKNGADINKFGRTGISVLSYARDIKDMKLVDILLTKE